MMMVVQSGRVILLMVVVMVMMVAAARGLLVVVVAGRVVASLMVMVVAVVMVIIVDRPAEGGSRGGRGLRVGQVAAAGEDVVDRVRAGPLQSPGGGGLMREPGVDRGRRRGRQLARRCLANWKRTGTELVGTSRFRIR